MKILNENTSIKTFHDTDVEVVGVNDDYWMTAESIGEALDYSEPRKNINKLYNRAKEELDQYSTIVSLTLLEGGLEKNREFRVFNERGLMIITMLSSQPRAREFRRWAVEVLSAYRKSRETISSPEPPAYDKQLSDMIVQAGKGNAWAKQMLKDRWGVSEPPMPEPQTHFKCPQCSGSYPFNVSDTFTPRH